MNITQIFLTGLAWILAAALVIGVLAIFLLATWMQVNDGKGQAYEANLFENLLNLSNLYFVLKQIAPTLIHDKTHKIGRQKKSIVDIIYSIAKEVNCEIGYKIFEYVKTK